jgi:hypothetical protein
MAISKKTRIAAIITLSFLIMMLLSMATTVVRMKMEMNNKKMETKNK